MHRTTRFLAPYCKNKISIPKNLNDILLHCVCQFLEEGELQYLVTIVQINRTWQLRYLDIFENYNILHSIFTRLFVCHSLNTGNYNT